MLINFALHKLGRRKSRNLLAVISIAIGIGSLLVFMGLNKGIKTATFQEMERRNPLTQITVRAPAEETGIIPFLTGKDRNQIQQHHIDEILAIRGVENVYPENQFNNFASIEIRIFGQTLITDAMVFGVPKGFIEDDINNPDLWDNREKPYPAVVPRQLLNIYNLTIAGPQNLPTLSEEALIGRTITLYPNYSTFFPTETISTERVEMEIVGFSDKVNLIGATIPFEIVETLNQTYTENPESRILELFVETQDATQTVAVAEKIEDLGFETFYFQKNVKDVEARLDYLRNSLGAISIIILAMAAIAIMSTFLATVSERAREIGLFRSLGATKGHIKKLILTEAGIMGITGSFLGVILGMAAGTLINKMGIEELDYTTLDSTKLVLFDYKIIIYAIIFGILLSLISAYIPARKAASTAPIEALNR